MERWIVDAYILLGSGEQFRFEYREGRGAQISAGSAPGAVKGDNREHRDPQKPASAQDR